MSSELKKNQENNPVRIAKDKLDKNRIGNDQISRQKIAQAIDALDWNWLRDKNHVFLVNIGADAEHGNLKSQYAFFLRPEQDNSIVLRLYALPWFSGLPAKIRNACDDWNCNTPYPKAALLRDDEGDSKLVLEWVVPCWDEAISQSLVNRWVEDFTYGCACFLNRYNDELQAALRYVPSQSSSSVH